MAAISSEWWGRGSGSEASGQRVRGDVAKLSNLEIAALNTFCNEALLMSFPRGLARSLGFLMGYYYYYVAQPPSSREAKMHGVHNGTFNS